MAAAAPFSVMSDEDLQSWGWTDLCVYVFVNASSSVVLLQHVSKWVRLGVRSGYRDLLCSAACRYRTGSA